MGRMQRFEFEDQPCFPATIRAYMVNILSFVARIGRDLPCRPLANRLVPAPVRVTVFTGVPSAPAVEA